MKIPTKIRVGNRSRLFVEITHKSKAYRMLKGGMRAAYDPDTNELKLWHEPRAPCGTLISRDPDVQRWDIGYRQCANDDQLPQMRTGNVKGIRYEGDAVYVQLYKQVDYGPVVKSKANPKANHLTFRQLKKLVADINRLAGIHEGLKVKVKKGKLRVIVE